MSTVKTVRRQDPARTLSGLCQDSVRTLSGLCQDCQDRCGRSTNQVNGVPERGERLAAPIVLVDVRRRGGRPLYRLSFVGRGREVVRSG